MRWVLMVCLVAMVVSLSAAAAAAPVPIEGTLLVQSWEAGGARPVHLMEGDSESLTLLPWSYDWPDVSPETTRVAYSSLFPSDPYPEAADIWVADLDGSDAANLSEAAGVGGVNCMPTWSPDGGMIAFQHADPAVGEPRCGSGWEVWLMAADGSEARPWVSLSRFETLSASWAPDGYHLLAESSDLSCVSGDLTGASVSVLPGVNGRDAEWSRDGSRFVYTTILAAEQGGAQGVVCQLILANADGSNPQVLVAQFVRDADIAMHVALHDLQPADSDWIGQVRYIAGPRKPKWSPRGDQVAFLAALPFDPSGPEFWYQVEVWRYEFSTGQVTRLTDNENQDDWLSWTGPNTLSAHPSVAVGSTSVTFSQVDQEGWTSIIRTDDVPALAAPYLPVGNTCEIRTAALVTGPAEVSMAYDAAAVPDTAEAHLKLLRYDEGTEQWQDTTVSRDLTNKVIYGETETLGLMGLAWPLPESHFSDVSDSVTDPFWALWEIEAAYAAGIVQGYGDGTYQPGRFVNRSQMAIYISRAVAGGDSLVPEPAAGTQSFPDVDSGDVAYYKYVEFCAGKNIVQGFWDGNYKPDKLVNRGQMAMYIARGLVQPGGDAAVPVATGDPTFPDVTADGTWAQCFNHVEYLAGLGVVEGFWDGNYHPERSVRRDQMAAYVARAFELPM